MTDTLFVVTDSLSVLMARTDVRIAAWVGFVGIVFITTAYICERILNHKED